MYWLIKSEPFKYSWDQFETDKKTFWDGVRNYQARNNMKAMQKGDQLFFYHSNEGKEIVGIAELVTEAYQDPTTEDPKWVVVDVKPVRRLKRPISLEEIKSTPALATMDLMKYQRLSVGKVSEDEWNLILKMSEEEK